MSATCLDIITSALKLARVLASGAVPSAAETEDGMDCLQSLYDEWVAGAMFGKLTDIYLTANDTAQEGHRYLLAAGVTLTEPTTIPATNTVDGIARQPRDLSLYESLTSTGTRSVRLYDRTGWVNLLDLATTDVAPLASRGKMGLAACLAVSGAFASMFGAISDPDVRAAANRFRASLSYKLGTTRDRTAAEYF